MKISNIRFSTLKSAVDKALDRQVSLFEDTSSWYEDKPVKFLVNWGGYGDETPEEARAYAEKIVEAAKIADGLNALEIEVVHGSLENDDVFKNNEFRKQYIEKMAMLLEDEEYRLVARMLVTTYYKVAC